MSDTMIGLIVGAFFGFVGFGIGALAMPNHPDRIRAAKMFFSLAALAFAFTLIQWTLSTDARLVTRAVIDFIAVTVGAVGFIAGLQFAERSELADLSAELSVPASALILEPLFVRSRKLMVLVVVGALAFSVLINVVREANWSWVHSEAIWSLPWRWILPSMVIGVIGVSLFLVVGSRTRKEQRRLVEKYKWLIELAAKQKDEIDEWVKVKGCERGDLNIHVALGDPQTVRLSIWVTNKSVLDISLSDKLTGVVKFQNMALTESKEVLNHVTDIPCGETACLTFEQRLSPSEVKAILDAQYTVRPQFYNFDELVVMIEGGKRSPDIEPKPLKIGPNFANAFPIDLQERGQRIRVLAEVRGSACQLYEPLRISSDNPLPKSDIEHWVSESLKTLERGYDEKAVVSLWREITHSEEIPEEAVSQGAWLRGCLTVLGSQLAYETGEYIRQPPIH